jgi:hypothetical protein
MIDYLTYNAIELTIVGLAFCFSKCKSIPLYIIIYTCIMIFIFAACDDYVSYMNGVRVDDATYNFNLAIIYMWQGSAMVLLGLTCLFMAVRLAFMLSVLILIQGVLSLAVCISIALHEMFFIDVGFVMDMHDLINNVYIVLYCLIAWICVFYSRTNYEYSRN